MHVLGSARTIHGSQVEILVGKHRRMPCATLVYPTCKSAAPNPLLSMPCFLCKAWKRFEQDYCYQYQYVYSMKKNLVDKEDWIGKAHQWHPTNDSQGFWCLGCPPGHMLNAFIVVRGALFMECCVNSFLQYSPEPPLVEWTWLIHSGKEGLVMAACQDQYGP